MNNVASVQSRIQAFITLKFPRTKKLALNENTSLLQSGIIDSQGILEVVSFLEQAFAIQCSDDDLTPENFDSLSSLAAFVESNTSYFEAAVK